MSADDPGVEALWHRVVAAWDDDGAHAAFLEYCRLHGRLAEAAVRYRGMTGDRDRGPSAEKRLQGVLMVAMSQLETSRTRASAARADWGRVLLIIFFLLATAALLVVGAPLLR